MAGLAQLMERVTGTRLLGMAHRHTIGSVMLGNVRSALGKQLWQYGFGLTPRLSWARFLRSLRTSIASSDSLCSLPLVTP